MLVKRYRLSVINYNQHAVPDIPRTYLQDCIIYLKVADETVDLKCSHTQKMAII